MCFKNCSFKKLVTTVSCSNWQRDDHHVSFEPTVMKFGQKKVSKKLFFLNCVSFLQISCHFYHSKLQIIKLDNFFPSALIFKKQTQFSQKRFSHGFCYPNVIKVRSIKPPWWCCQKFDQDKEVTNFCNRIFLKNADKMYLIIKFQKIDEKKIKKFEIDRV